MTQNLPNHLHYTRDHEWVSIENNQIILGVTAYAQEALGDLVFIELPEVGAHFDAGDTCAVVESVKAASEVYAPISMKIQEVNNALENAPELVNSQPYEDGWLCKGTLEDPNELEELMSAEDYQAYLDGLSD